jgi:hypothetical protein
MAHRQREDATTREMHGELALHLSDESKQF